MVCFYIAFALSSVNISQRIDTGSSIKFRVVSNVLARSKTRNPTWFPVLCLMSAPEMHKWKQKCVFHFKSCTHPFWNLVSDDEELTKLF